VLPSLFIRCIRLVVLVTRYLSLQITLVTSCHPVTSCQVFGAYLSDTIQISEKFYGNGKSFLFRLAPAIEFFKWTAANSYVLMGNKDSLVVGGGG